MSPMRWVFMLSEIKEISFNVNFLGVKEKMRVPF